LKGFLAVSAELRIRELDEPRFAEWDRFVAQCEQATFFHRAGWKRVLERGLSHRSYFLYAERAGTIVGVLPLVHIKSVLFGNSLSSLGFCVYGGPAAGDGDTRAALDKAARELAERLDVAHLEYRHLEPHRYDGAVEKGDLYFTFRKPIDPEIEKNLLAIPRKQRAMVRKGQKFGLVAETDDDCKRLHRIYAESVRNLGTPVFSRRYFDELKREFADDCEVLVVTLGGEPVSAVMSFYFRDEVLPYYGGGRARARDVAANDFMYWEVMRRACQRGCRVFDFGRSKFGTGAFDFKKNWGFLPQGLSYQYIVRRGDKPPDVNPLNPKFRLFVAAWKRLPLPVANLLGPHIVRQIG
jgi:FemAB-related protein (PEP-CTERM system-associated)